MMDVEGYWNEYKKKEGLSADAEYFEAFSFGLNGEEADELLDLVLSGKKRATTSVYLENERNPQTGDFSIVLNSKGEPSCIIKTTSVRIMRFKDMTFDICKKEGEDEILETWRITHEKMLKEEGKERGYEFSEDILILFEEFTVVCQ